MVIKQKGLFYQIRTRKPFIFGLFLSFFIHFITSQVQAEVKLKGVSLEPSVPGDWTVARVRIENSGDRAEKVELKWTMGSVEASVFEQNTAFEMPSRSVRVVWAPLWVPSDILKEAPKNNNSKQRDFINLSVQLFQNGALKSRETALGIMEGVDVMRGMNIGRNRDELNVYDPLAALKPSEGAVTAEALSWGKNRWDFKLRSDELQGFGYLYPDILERKAIIWLEKGFDSTKGLWRLLNWVERGGLLIIDPMRATELGPIATMLEIEPGESTWSAIEMKEWLMDGSQVLLGRDMHASSDWKKVLSDDGVTLASTRKWGLGSIVMLHYRWNGLIGKERERAKKVLESLMPQTLANGFEANKWNDSAQHSLVMRHGNSIWSREAVMSYLGSLMLVSLLLWSVPFFKDRRELRWSLWTMAMFAWAGAGLVVYLSKTSAGAKFSSEIISLGKSGGSTEKIHAYSAFYSESQRRFSLGFRDGMDVNRLTGTKSTSMSREILALSIKDFSLQPMRINLLKWNQSQQIALPEVELVWSDTLRLTCPASLDGKEVALVVGRRIWEFKAQVQMSLALEQGVLLTQQSDTSALYQTAYRLSTQSSDKKGSLSSGHYWLIWKEQRESPFDFPNDIERDEQWVSVLILEPSYQSGPFQLSPGMSEWSFRRGKGVRTWKTGDIGFDGLDFANESINMNLGWRFELPEGLRERLNVDGIRLKLKALPEGVKQNGIYLIDQDKRSRLTINGDSITIPKESLQAGAIEIEVQPPMPKIGVSNMTSEAWKPWIEGIEIKGKIK